LTDGRYASAAALAQDIQNYLDGRPVQAGPDTWTYRINKFVRRNSRGVSSAAGVVVLIAGLATVYTFRLAAERDLAALGAKSLLHRSVTEERMGAH